MTPATPNDVERREELSDEYQDRKATIDFYTNNTIAIYRGEEDTSGASQRRVWLGNLEKQELLKALKDEIEE